MLQFHDILYLLISYYEGALLGKKVAIQIGNESAYSKTELIKITAFKASLQLIKLTLKPFLATVPPVTSDRK